MSTDVKWIKLLTSLPDDEKIKLIEAMPDRDAIFYIWIRLLIQAGKCNSRGYIYLAPDIPFTAENFSTLFNRSLNTIRLALSTFEQLRMIEIHENGLLYIPRFPEIQNTDGLNKIREDGRLRQTKYRQSHKMISDALGNEKITLPNDTEQEQEQEEEKNTTETNDNNSDGEVFTSYDENIGKLSPLIVDELKDAIEQYGSDKVTEAIGIAVKANAKNVRYIMGVLKNNGNKRNNGHHDIRTEKPGEHDPERYVGGAYGHMVMRTSEQSECINELRAKQGEL